MRRNSVIASTQDAAKLWKPNFSFVKYPSASLHADRAFAVLSVASSNFCFIDFRELRVLVNSYKRNGVQIAGKRVKGVATER